MADRDLAQPSPRRHVRRRIGLRRDAVALVRVLHVDLVVACVSTPDRAAWLRQLNHEAPRLMLFTLEDVPSLGAKLVEHLECLAGTAPFTWDRCLRAA